MSTEYGKCQHFGCEKVALDDNYRDYCLDHRRCAQCGALVDNPNEPYRTCQTCKNNNDSATW